MSRRARVLAICLVCFAWLCADARSLAARPSAVLDAGVVATATAPPTVSRAQRERPRSKQVNTFSLVQGTFTLTFADGTLTGTYHGLAALANTGQQSALIDLQITGGTGQFEGAIGSLEGTGTGHFIDEGEFALTLKGTALTDSRTTSLRLAVRGAAGLSCLEDGVTHVAMQSAGKAPRLGTVVAAFEHDLGSGGGCDIFPDRSVLLRYNGAGPVGRQDNVRSRGDSNASSRSLNRVVVFLHFDARRSPAHKEKPPHGRNRHSERPVRR
jgi:hypothetical protein